ncbi:MAG: DUF1800 domain-containing protein, partial [Methylococcaceae bacterium]|nr:DUF1800 domain-containing protein [Methylococcaceae bacterium]
MGFQTAMGQPHRRCRHFLAAAGLLLWLAGAALNPALAKNGKPNAAEAARFLNHASFGPNSESLARVMEIGYEAYLNEQFDLVPKALTLEPMPYRVPDTCDDTCRRDNYSIYPLQRRFFENALTDPAQLRQRMAFALSQILVISGRDSDLWMSSSMLPYLDMLEQNAFGSYRTLLEAVTLSPAMGRYLDMAGNRKDAPNENYARELLQLFSIGLFELKPTGKLKLVKGKPKPTYSQNTITEFARALTGWNLAAELGTDITNFRDPMVVDPNQHDNQIKTLLKGLSTPQYQTPYEDLQMALDNVVSHPNVAPFISYRLIQRLVTSNPSPAYVGRVATAFRKTKGDLKKVVKAILLDREALKPPGKNAGHLREPVLWLTHLLRAFDTGPTTTDYALSDSYLPGNLRMGQDVYRSPTVFNYFPPDYQIPGEKLKGPEFALYQSTDVVNRANLAYALVYNKMPTWEGYRPTGTWLNLEPLLPLAEDPKALLDELNKRMLNGAMLPTTRTLLENALSAIPGSSPLERVRYAVYSLAVSPEYLIER